MIALLSTAKTLILEQGRRSSSLVLLGIMVFLGYYLRPSTWRSFGARGLYTSGYIGAAVATRSALLFLILGFFLVRSSIEDDRRSGVGEILASTPMKRLDYLLGKMLGIVGYICMLMMILYTMTAVVQILHGEAPFRPLILAWPFLLFILPEILFVSGLALFLDVVPLLRKWPGDVLFMITMFQLSARGQISGFIPLIMEKNSYLSTHPSAFTGTGADKVFYWTGMPVAWHVIWPQLQWIVLGFALALAASLFFERFVQAPGHRWWLFRRESVKETRESLPFSDTLVASLPTSPTVAAPRWVAPFISLIAEVYLILKKHWWYWLGCVGLLIAAVLVPEESLHLYVLPMALVLPIGIIANLGCRETQEGTNELVFSLPRLKKWYPFWKWSAGFLVSWLALVGPLLEMIRGGQIFSAIALCVGAGFMVALAVSFGVWTGGYRLFLAVYTFLWWMMINGINKNALIWLDWSGIWYSGKYPSVIGLYTLLIIGLIGISTLMTRKSLLMNK